MGRQRRQQVDRKMQVYRVEVRSEKPVTYLFRFETPLGNHHNHMSLRHSPTHPRPSTPRLTSASSARDSGPAVDLDPGPRPPERGAVGRARSHGTAAAWRWEEPHNSSSSTRHTNEELTLVGSPFLDLGMGSRPLSWLFSPFWGIRVRTPPI